MRRRRGWRSQMTDFVPSLVCPKLDRPLPKVKCCKTTTTTTTKASSSVRGPGLVGTTAPVSSGASGPGFVGAPAPSGAHSPRRWASTKFGPLAPLDTVAGAPTRPGPRTPHDAVVVAACSLYQPLSHFTLPLNDSAYARHALARLCVPQA